MKLKEYQSLSKRTLADLGSVQDNIIHMKAGVIGELGELIDVFKKWFAYGKEFDRVNAREECGDIAFFLVNTANILNIQLEDEFANQKVDVELDIMKAFDYTMSAVDQQSILFQSYSPSIERIKYMIYRLVSICELLDFSIEDVFERNVAKLTQRFPNKFTQEDATNRDLESELKVLSV